MPRLFIAVTFSSALFCSLAPTIPANGQGSTGGFVGKSDRSASGGGEPRAPRHVSTSHIARPVEPSTCGHVAGTWSWFNGDLNVLNPGGTARSSAGSGSVTGNWSCINGHVLIVWSNGYNDRLSLSSNGDHLEGSNGFVRVFGDRR